jgi:phosphate transport system protein
LARLLDIAMERLSDILLNMALISEKSVERAIRSYASGESESEEIRKASIELRNNEEDVSELAFELIARYQPVASDLRFIKASMEISYGFLRFGRYALDIAEVLEIFGSQSACDHTMVEATAKATLEMLRMSIDAFTTRDAELAKQVPPLDDYVDEKYRSHVASIVRDPSPNKCQISAMLILRYLERIADHAASVGESVVYIETGEVLSKK